MKSMQKPERIKSLCITTENKDAMAAHGKNSPDKMFEQILKPQKESVVKKHIQHGG